ncbi:unnamed protein product [Lactuca saligna]|uniref:Ribosomal protein S16 n=1 Tax=Lactuca saligna TaxID=75948 RepID=A0AA35Z671_LACSI|nr:unnamed protein product [Lactuca saligna]
MEFSHVWSEVWSSILVNTSFAAPMWWNFSLKIPCVSRDQTGILEDRTCRNGGEAEIGEVGMPEQAILQSQDGGKRMGLNFERVKYWLSVGAQPSDPVQRLLFRAGILPPPPMVAMGRKGGPRDTRPVDPLSGRVMMPDQPTKPSIKSGDEENKS